MKKILSLSLMLCLLSINALRAADDSTVLFHETFGDNSSSAREWKDDYSVKLGVEAVYKNVKYTISEAKQTKNSLGQTASGLISSQGKAGTFIVGPLDVSNYASLEVSNYWGGSAGKDKWNTEKSYMKCYYSLDNSSWNELSRVGDFPNGAVANHGNLVAASYTLPEAAEGYANLYLKFEFYCYQLNSNSAEIGQAYFDEIELKGIESSSNPSEPTVSFRLRRRNKTPNFSTSKN